MRDLVQRKFLDQVIGSAAEKSNGWMILVLDDESTRVISSALSMYDIMEKRISLVEQLHLKRQPFPEMDVVYFVSSSMNSIKRIIADFSSSDKSMYGNVHIFTLESVSDECMALIQKNQKLLERIQTFTEAQINFITSESNVFHLDLPSSLHQIFGNEPDPNFADRVAAKLTTLCITLNEHPIIKYQSGPSFPKLLAVLLQQNLIEYRAKNPSFWTYGDEGHQEKERAVMVLLDRSFDPLTPLMHDYTYQTLAQDLLPIADNTIAVEMTTNAGDKKTEKSLLSENDELWVSLRHLHIARVIQNITDRMKLIMQTNHLAKEDKNLSLAAMSEAVKSLPEFRQTMAKLNQHVNIAQQCMSAFTKKSIWEVSQLEQFMTTGFDNSNSPLKKPQLMQEMVEMLENKKIEDMTKLRLLAILSITQHNNSSEQERLALFRAASLDPADQNVMKNLERLTTNFNPTPMAQPLTTKVKGGFFTNIFSANAPDGIIAESAGDVTDSRHVAQLQPILEKMIAGDLSADQFPNIDLIGPSGAKQVVKSARRAGNLGNLGGKKMLFGSRNIVFIAGGLTYAEMRVAYDAMEKNGKEVIIGGTHLITPSSYVAELKTLDVAHMSLKNTGSIDYSF